MSVLYDLEDITRRYGDRTVLSIEQLGITAGEAVALIGPSGAGKSTLLRIMCLLEAPTTGTLRYADQIIGSEPPLVLRRQITLVFQRPLLLDTTVERNIAYSLRLRGATDRGRVADLIDLLGLRSVARAQARTLSGGEMQRVALARALVIKPRMLLLDEPTANLDPRNVAIMEHAITTLHREQRTTIMIATHNLHQAQRLTQRTLMLLDGQVIEDGATDQVLTAAQDRRTRAFVDGSMIY